MLVDPTDDLNIAAAFQNMSVEDEDVNYASDSSESEDIKTLDQACRELEAYNSFLTTLILELKEAMIDQGQGLLKELRVEIVNVMITQVSIYEHVVCKYEDLSLES